jgi:hypothetical protein
MIFAKNATVVLVHGAWADGTSWQAIIHLASGARLERDRSANSPHFPER